MTENLSPRQKELFSMLIKGVPPKEIAYNLNIAYNTLLFHQKNLYRKLSVHNVKELMIKYSPKINEEAENEMIPEPGTITVRKSLLFGTFGILIGLLTVTVVLLSVLFFKLMN